MAITLKAARVNADLKQRDAAKAIGVTVDTLSSWENGNTEPRVSEIKKMEELYKIQFRDIIFLKN